MNRTLPAYSLPEGRNAPPSGGNPLLGGRRALLARGIEFGCLGGLAGTLLMDLLLMGILPAFGQPALMCFSIVGDTVSRFLGLFGMQMAGGVPTGVVTHYVIGALVGILFGAAVTMLPAFREGTLKQITIASFLYVEILSQPILAAAPVLLEMDASAILQWYVGSFIMHLILSIVLGLIVGSGLRQSPWQSKSVSKEKSASLPDGALESS